MFKSNTKSIDDILGRGPIHPFPARMAPGVALDALGDSKTPLQVLDPMMGSGTVLAVARAKGHCATGVDLDPLAVLLASVWTRTVNPGRVTGKAVEVLDRARGGFENLHQREAYPPRSDDETKVFVRYWFDEHARRQLAALAAAISRVRDSVTRDVLWCSFSRLIITKSAGASLAMDLSHSRPHRKFDRAPVKPFDRFLAAVEKVVSNCPQPASGHRLGPRTVVGHGDARRLNIKASSIDLVLTSPPYLNGIDYLRCSKFSLVWMGHSIGDLRAIRSESVGTEASLQEAANAPWVTALVRQLRLRPKLTNRDVALLSRYVWDMSDALSEVSRVLRKGGRAVYVIGDSMSRGTFIRNSKIIEAIASRNGLSTVSRRARTLPANRRYLPPPGNRASGDTLDGRLRREIVIEFKKP